MSCNPGFGGIECRYEKGLGRYFLYDTVENLLELKLIMLIIMNILSICYIPQRIKNTNA